MIFAIVDILVTASSEIFFTVIPELIDLDDDLDAPVPERFAELAKELGAHHSDPEVRRIVRAVGGAGFNLNLFPNISCSLAFLRVLQPVSVDKTEIRHVALGMDGGPSAANRARMRIHEFFQGPMGFGSPDDAEVWDRIQHGAQGGPELWVMLNRGLAGETDTPEGHRRGDISAETDSARGRPVPSSRPSRPRCWRAATASAPC